MGPAAQLARPCLARHTALRRCRHACAPITLRPTHRRQSYRGYSVLAVQLALFGAILGSVYYDAAESYVIAGQLYKMVDAPGQVLQAQIGA